MVLLNDQKWARLLLNMLLIGGAMNHMDLKRRAYMIVATLISFHCKWMHCIFFHCLQFVYNWYSSKQWTNFTVKEDIWLHSVGALDQRWISTCTGLKPLTINLCRCWNEPEHGAAYSTNQWKTAMHKTAPLLATRVPDVSKGTSGMVRGCTCLSASIWEQLDGMPHSTCCFTAPLIF